MHGVKLEHRPHQEKVASKTRLELKHSPGFSPPIFQRLGSSRQQSLIVPPIDLIWITIRHAYANETEDIRKIGRRHPIMPYPSYSIRYDNNAKHNKINYDETHSSYYREPS